MATAKATFPASLDFDIVEKLDVIRNKEGVSRNSLVELATRLLLKQYSVLGNIDAVRARLRA